VRLSADCDRQATCYECGDNRFGFIHLTTLSQAPHLRIPPERGHADFIYAVERLLEHDARHIMAAFALRPTPPTGGRRRCGSLLTSLGKQSK
jgi:hypothetical protein